MSSKGSNDLDAFDSPAANLIVSPLGDEVETSFLEYSYAVIHSRALPDARDGLKPVHRRILYGMAGLGLKPGTPYMKSARVVGEVMGRYHPHGDSAIYEAMVRLAQDFNLNTPFVDGQGNFGSPNDAPAASRYTEARMSAWAELMVGEMKESTVDFRPNYDGSLQEPVVLPAAFPNLLVNGSTGIAVGMSTNMIPHNLSEVLAAARWVLTHPNASLDKLMEFVPGPDLPTGGLLLGLDEVRKAYETGRGVVRLRARSQVEPVQGSRGRQQIAFTELPYGVGTEKVIEAVKKEIASGRLQGIADVKDLSDRVNGTRLVVEAKVGVNPDVLLGQLFKYTPLESSFGIINLALVDGQPRILGLLELLQVFVEHRVDVVRRRSEHRRSQMADRLHLVDGLLVALLDIDQVIKVVRGAEDAAEAKSQLMSRFGLSEIQTQYILDTPLRRLTKYDRLALEQERAELQAGIGELEEILGDETLLRGLVGKEIEQVARANQTERRTTLMDGNLQEVLAATVVEAPLEAEDEPCEVALSADGLIVRRPIGAATSARRVKHDAIADVVTSRTRSDVVVVTSTGRAFKVQVLGLPMVPDGGSAAGGVAAAEVVPLAPGERVVGLAPYATESGHGLALGTRDGVVKVQPVNWPTRADEWTVISLKDGDEVVGARWLESPDAEFVFVTSEGNLLAFDAGLVRPQGSLTAAGMAGVKLSADARAVAFGVVRAEEAPDAVVVTSTGASTKVTPLAEYPRKGRGTGGVRCQRFLAGETPALAVAAVGAGLKGVSRTGAPLSLPDVNRRRDGSGAPATPPDLFGR